MTPLAPPVEPLYLDFAASAPPAEEVVDAMLPWLTGKHANPHADHWHGQRAAQAINQAREAIATLIGGDPEGVIFTSGATEANNLALKGLLGPQRSRLWISKIEHKSLLEPARVLEQVGVEVKLLDVDRRGRLISSALADQLQGNDPGPGLVAVGHGNNEIGTIQDIASLARIAHENGHWLHVDASQTAGNVPLAVTAEEIDLLCISSHKMYGPAGIGALYVDPGLLSELRPLLHGGGQERGLRSGTIAPFLAVGFGKAAELAHRRIHQHRQHLEVLARSFLDVLDAQGFDYALMGDPIERIPGHVSLYVPGVWADDLLGRLLPWLSASSGAACASGERKASHVLREVGLNETQASQVIRISFGRTTQASQALEAGSQLLAALRRIHEIETGGSDDN